MQACILHTEGQGVPLLSEFMANPHRDRQLWTSQGSQAPQPSTSRGNYQVWVQTCRVLEWVHAPVVLTVSLLSHICSAVTFPHSQSPLQLISPLKADSQTGQWKKMGAGREREEHTAWGRSTLLGSTQLPESITFHGPWGWPCQGCCAYPSAARPCHSTEQSHPYTPSLPWAQGMCVEPLCISSPSRQATEVSQQGKCSGSAQSATTARWHCLCTGLLHRFLPSIPQGHWVTPAPHTACSQSTLEFKA